MGVGVWLGGEARWGGAGRYALVCGLHGFAVGPVEICVRAVDAISIID